MHITAVCILAPLFAANLLIGCLQDNPRFDLATDSSGADPGGDTPADPTGATTEPGTSTSTSTGEPTTGAGTSSTGEPVSSSTGDESSGESTEGMQFPTCPYHPPGVEVSVMLSDGGATQDETLRPCGAMETFSPLRSVGYDGIGHHFERCADDLCGACDPTDLLDLGFAVPDPFNGGASTLAEGSCARLQVVWERPIPEDAALCRPSRVALVELEEGTPAAIPAVLYRHAQALPVSDIVGELELSAAAAGPGPIECACEGDCCREDPGSREVDFTVVISGGPAAKIPTLESQQAVQGIDVGAIESRPATGSLALVRAFFPTVCLDPPQYEWLFDRTASRP